MSETEYIHAKVVDESNEGVMLRRGEVRPLCIRLFYFKNGETLDSPILFERCDRVSREQAAPKFDFNALLTPE